MNLDALTTPGGRMLLLALGFAMGAGMFVGGALHGNKEIQEYGTGMMSHIGPVMLGLMGIDKIQRPPMPPPTGGPQ